METLPQDSTLCCGFKSLTARAYELADTGRYEDWQAIAVAIEQEDCPGALKRLAADRFICTMLNTRCWQARNHA